MGMGTGIRIVIIGPIRITVTSARPCTGPTATGSITGIIGITGTGTEPALVRLSTGGWERPPVIFLALPRLREPSSMKSMATCPGILFSNGLAGPAVVVDAGFRFPAATSARFDAAPVNNAARTERVFLLRDASQKRAKRHQYPC